MAETPDPGEPSASMIVGFAVWDVFFINKANKGSDYEPQNRMSCHSWSYISRSHTVAAARAIVAQAGGAKRRDVDPRRQAAFRAAGIEGKERFFDNVWGHQQLHLQILGVRPDHWRRGIGSELVRWGMNTATAKKIPLTVLASPMGLHLYTRLGFRKLGRSITQVPGEDEKVDTECLVYESPSL